MSEEKQNIMSESAEKRGSNFNRKWKRILRYLSFLNPQKLAEEVQIYGYHFSWKANILTICGVLLGMGAIGILFQLKLFYFLLEIAVVILLFPTFVLFMYMQMYEQKRFADAVTYAEQILYSFQKNRKIISALRETLDTFEDGKMRMAIEDAIEYIEAGFSKTEEGILIEALAIIEKSYDCLKIRMIHKLLISSEEHGGDTNQALFLLLNDIENWKRRGYKLQSDKKESHRDNMISVIVATILCLISLYALSALGTMFPAAQGVDIFAVEMIQISSVIFILFLLFALTRSFKSLTVNWLKNESLYDTSYILSCYNKIIGFDEKKEKKKSVRVASIAFISAVLAFVFQRFWIGILFIIITGMMLMRHRIGYNMAKRDVKDELYMELPQWLMEIALLLQNNNVQVSIIKSIEGASPLLQRELYILVERLELAPEALSSYVKFCQRFDIPEAQSCMKMFHAISESGTGDSQIQIHNLLKRVQEMQDMADDIRLKEQAFQMKILFVYPVIGATAKLLLDLSVGMFYLFSLVGSMGGA